MDPSSVRTTSSVDEDEWDTEGFVIPSLGIEDPEQNKSETPKLEEPNPSQKQDKSEEIYLGPYGAPPQLKQQDLNLSNRKKRLKQKLKEADKRVGGTDRENKLENLRELVGSSGRFGARMAKESSRDWLDPHCNESQFERRKPQ